MNDFEFAIIANKTSDHLKVLKILVDERIHIYCEKPIFHKKFNFKKLRENIKVRKNNFNRQCNFFDKHKKYFSNPVEKENINTAWLAFPILINKDAPFSRKEFQIYLEKRKIQTRVVFTGNVVRQPMMKNVKYKVTGSGYKNADAVMERGVLLPLHHGLTDSMFERLHKTISEFLEGFK